MGRAGKESDTHMDGLPSASLVESGSGINVLRDLHLPRSFMLDAATGPLEKRH